MIKNELLATFLHLLTSMCCPLEISSLYFQTGQIKRMYCAVSVNNSSSIFYFLKKGKLHHSFKKVPFETLQCIQKGIVRTILDLKFIPLNSPSLYPPIISDLWSANYLVTV